MTAYETVCKQHCEFCAKGNKRVVHYRYGARHILTHGDSWAESEHIECTAPTLEQFSEEQAAQITGLEAERTAVSSMGRKIRGKMVTEKEIENTEELVGIAYNTGLYSDIPIGASYICAIYAPGFISKLYEVMKRSEAEKLNIPYWFNLHYAKIDIGTNPIESK